MVAFGRPSSSHRGCFSLGISVRGRNRTWDSRACPMDSRLWTGQMENSLGELAAGPSDLIRTYPVEGCVHLKDAVAPNAIPPAKAAIYPRVPGRISSGARPFVLQPLTPPRYPSGPVHCRESEAAEHRRFPDDWRPLRAKQGSVYPLALMLGWVQPKRCGAAARDRLPGVAALPAATVPGPGLDLFRREAHRCGAAYWPAAPND
jgi:hypothetical protein